LNKVIESIALGVPVVATSIAVEGLPNELKKYVYVADNSKEFSQLVLEILKKPALRNQLWKEGQFVIREMLGWEKVVNKFENDLEDELVQLKSRKK